MIPALELHRVGVRPGAAAELLSDVSLLLAPGEVLTVAGAAGAGKSLLLDLATLRCAPSRGEVRLFGQPAAAANGAQRAALRRRIGRVEAAAGPVAGLDPVDAAALPLRLAGMARAEARARAAELLDWLGDGDGPERHGRVALARAVLGGPELVLVDELAACPPALLGRLLALVERLRRQGTAFIIASRDEELLRRVPADGRARLARHQLEVIDRRGAAPLLFRAG